VIDAVPETQTRIEIDEQGAAILEELVATPSVSGNERHACDVFARRARGLGLWAHIDQAGNAVAVRGPLSGARREIVLLGHIDTVPGTIRVRREGDVLHGRGTVDAKGPLVAMLLAAARAELPRDVTVRVAGAVGEETPRSPGARFIAQTWRTPDACIIGEPSGWDGVTLGYKGRCVATLRVERDCAHSAGPGESASDAVIAWRERVVRSLPAQGAALAVFDRVQHTVRGLRSSSSGITDVAEVVVGFRLPPGVTPEGVRGVIGHAAPEGGSFTTEGEEVAHLSARSDEVVSALTGAVRAAGGRGVHKRKTGTSDMNVVSPMWRCPIAAYGPGDSSLDHTPEERVDLREFTRAVRVLEGALGVLGEGAGSGVRVPGSG